MSSFYFHSFVLIRLILIFIFVFLFQCLLWIDVLRYATCLLPYNFASRLCVTHGKQFFLKVAQKRTHRLWQIGRKRQRFGWKKNDNHKTHDMASVAIVKSVRLRYLAHPSEWAIVAKTLVPLRSIRHVPCYNINVCINNAFRVHCLLMTSNLKRLMAKYAHFISYIFIMQCNEAAIFSRNFKFYFKSLSVCVSLCG